MFLWIYQTNYKWPDKVVLHSLEWPFRCLDFKLELFTALQNVFTRKLSQSLVLLLTAGWQRILEGEKGDPKINKYY